jgi:sRNA-binding protein
MYQQALQAGAQRIDLEGKPVSVVTEAEAAEARKKVADDRERYLARQEAIKTIPKPEAPPMAKPPSKSASTTTAPELEAVHAAFMAANITFGTPSGPLRSAMATTALRVMIKEAQRVINDLASGDADTDDDDVYIVTDDVTDGTVRGNVNRRGL